jgi:hypothetical protein
VQLLKSEFPPPVVNQVKKKEKHPEKMDPVNLVFLRVLNNMRNAAKQMGHTQTYNNSEEDFDVKI